MKSNCDTVFRIFLTTAEQLSALTDVLKENKNACVDRIYLDCDALSEENEVKGLCRKIKEMHPETEIFLSLPQVLRKKDEPYLQALCDMLTKESELFGGILTGNLEGLGFFRECLESRQDVDRSGQFKMIGDHNFYLWNSSAVSTWEGLLDGACLPLELNGKEQEELLKATGKEPLFWDRMVYGYLPLMFTANCLAKTAGHCHRAEPGKKRRILSLQDRMNIRFPVGINCMHCYNTIFNSVPLSLHGHWKHFTGKSALRLSFTLEQAGDTKKILNWFLKEEFQEKDRPFQEYTTGHEKRGVL